MVTGIEAAGLALAAFPLVIEGLKFYQQGCRTLSNWKNYIGVLKRYVRELKMESTKFQNTCTLLLEDMVSPEELEKLLQEPGGARWEERPLQKALEQRLRPEVLPAYLEGMQELNSILDELRVEIGMGSDNMPELLDRKAQKRQWKKIKLILREESNELRLGKITKINADLAVLTGQQKPVSRVSGSVSLAAVEHYIRIRETSFDLYNVLREKLQTKPSCPCAVPHIANLQLEARRVTGPKRCGVPQGPVGPSPRFKIHFSFECSPTRVKWEWGSAEFEQILEQLADKQGGPLARDTGAAVYTHSPSSTPTRQLATDLDSGFRRPIPRPPSPLRKLSDRVNLSKGIESTAAALLNTLHLVSDPKSDPQAPRGQSSTQKTRVRFVDPAPPPHYASATPKSTDMGVFHIHDLCQSVRLLGAPSSCLGIIIGEPNKAHRVWSASILLPLAPTTTSLATLLQRSDPPLRRQRVTLGVQLASAMTQLHESEWLQGSWSACDIWFLQVGEQPLLERPLLRRIFHACVDENMAINRAQTKQLASVVDYNESLFSLGVILVELWFGRRLETLRTEEEAADASGYSTARRLASTVADDAGAKYGDAVRRCVKGLDHRHNSLEKRDFKKEVLAKIVAPLEEHLDAFCGDSLDEL